MTVFMSINPCYFNRFSVSTCNTLLKKIIVDAQSLIQKKERRIIEIRDEVSKLLLTPEERIAHIAVLYLFSDTNLIKLLKFLVNFCEVVAHNLSLIESQREVPHGLKQAIASLCYVGASYSELSDMQKLLSQFSKKYGKEFITNVTQLKADFGVKEEIIEWLLVPNPTLKERNKLIKEIANQFGIDWDKDMVVASVDEDQNKLPEGIAANQCACNHVERNDHTMFVLCNSIPCYYKRFNISTCDTLLQKIIVDAQSLIEKKERHIIEIREEVSKLLQTREERIAHIEVLYLFSDTNLIKLLKFLVYFCGVVADNLLYIESQREVPPDLKQAVTSICYVGGSGRYSELPDLKKLLSQFSRKYGKEFTTNVIKLEADFGVKKEMIEWLLVPNPTIEERNKLLKEIANQFGIDWGKDMAASVDVDQNKLPERSILLHCEDMAASVDVDQNKLPERFVANQVIVEVKDSMSHENM